MSVGIPEGTRLELDANSFSGKVDLPSPERNPAPVSREMTVTVKLISGDLRIGRVD